MGRAGSDYGESSVGESYAVVSRLLELEPLALGMSTGWDQEARGDWEQLQRNAEQFNPFCFELSALSVDELPSLVHFSSRKMSWSPDLSFHGPAKGMGEAEIARVVPLLAHLARYGPVIMHPDTMGELNDYRVLESKLLIENMDARKPIGATPEQLEKIFRQLYLAGFCLDLAHVKTLDPTMALGHELLDRFADRLGEVHISSVDQGCHHIETNLADIELYAPLLARATHVPWILESAPAE